jgi:hypothetical protein
VHALPGLRHAGTQLLSGHMRVIGDALAEFGGAALDALA